MSEQAEPTPPETSDVDLQNGIFNLVVTLVKYYQAGGVPLNYAANKVATMLDEITDGLRNSVPQNKKDN